MYGLPLISRSLRYCFLLLYASFFSHSAVHADTLCRFQSNAISDIDHDLNAQDRFDADFLIGYWADLDTPGFLLHFSNTGGDYVFAVESPDKSTVARGRYQTSAARASSKIIYLDLAGITGKSFTSVDTKNWVGPTFYIDHFSPDFISGRATGGSGPPTFRWKRHGERVTGNSCNIINIAMSDFTNSVLPQIREYEKRRDDLSRDISNLIEEIEKIEGLNYLLFGHETAGSTLSDWQRSQIEYAQQFLLSRPPTLVLALIFVGPAQIECRLQNGMDCGERLEHNYLRPMRRTLDQLKNLESHRPNELVSCKRIMKELTDMKRSLSCP